jgi:mannose-6-phosphate isomerase-like protein (cupin superfamily)
MKGYHANIEELTLKNDNFRQVLYTGKHTQLVLMSLLPNQDIGLEIHAENDQFFRFESGQGLVVIDGTEYPVADGSAIVVPAGSQHNIINTSATEKLKLYTLYSPPHHKDQIVRLTKEEAESNDQEFDGQTTETA